MDEQNDRLLDSRRFPGLRHGTGDRVSSVYQFIARVIWNRPGFHQSTTNTPTEADHFTLKPLKNTTEGRQLILAHLYDTGADADHPYQSEWFNKTTPDGKDNKGSNKKYMSDLYTGRLLPEEECNITNKTVNFVKLQAMKPR